MPSFGEHQVACCISDQTTARRVLDALRREGARGFELSRSELVSGASRQRLRALIWDLAPWDPTALEVLHAVRGRHPGCPILLYAPPTTEAAALATEASGLVGVYAAVQLDIFSGEELRLRHCVRWLLDGVPATMLRWATRQVLSDAPAVKRRFLEAALDSLAAHAAVRVTATDCATAAGVTLRCLQRACRSRGLPPPKRLLDLVVLLYVTLLAQWHGESAGAAARRVGLHRQDLRRLRRRVLPRRVRVARLGPAQEFNVAFLALARAFGVPRKRASQLVRAVA